MHLVGGVEQIDDESRAIYGKVVEMAPGTFFPAYNWFDVFVEIRTELGTFANRKPEHMVAEIDRLPPSFAITPYASTTEINLYPLDSAVSGARSSSVAELGDPADPLSLAIAPLGAILLVEHSSD